MFYVKAKVSEDAIIHAEITDTNVFTVCPECGIEHAVDLTEILTTGGGDLCSTVVCCPVCSKRR